VYDVDSCQDDDDECLGFASLPEQVHRKAVKRGFDFTVMVVGSSRLPVSRFPLLQFGAAFSSPAFFGHAFLTVALFPVSRFQSPAHSTRLRLIVIGTAA